MKQMRLNLTRVMVVPHFHLTKVHVQLEMQFLVVSIDLILLQLYAYLVGGFNPKILKKKKTSKIGPTLPPILGVKIPKKYLSWPPPRYDIHPKNVDLLYLPYVVLAVQRCDSNAPMLRSPASSETGGNLEDFCHPEVPWK